MRPVFLGTEASQAPEVVELVGLARRVAARAGARAGGVLALRNGPRCILNVGELPFSALGLGDFVEVADYDPLTGQLFCLGTRLPAGDAPLFAMLFRAKAEVGAAALLRLAPDSPALADLDGVERHEKPIVAATALLRVLREGDAAVLGGSDLVVAAPTLPKLAARLDALLAKAPPAPPAPAADDPEAPAGGA